MKSFIKKIFHSSTATIITVNVVVFVTLGIIHIILDKSLLWDFALVGNFKFWSLRPWGIVTYMFFQADVINLLFNMLWFWGFGMILERYEGNRTVVWTYLVSGLSGGVAFLVSMIGVDRPSFLIGASAAVIGVITAAAIFNPRLRLNLVLFGNVELRWVALFAILICGIAPGLNGFPTLMAHLGGVLGGAIFAIVSKRRTVILRRRSNKIKRNVRQQERRGLLSQEQEEMDFLLDKVRINGYKSLSMKERNRLFELSNKINR